MMVPAGSRRERIWCGLLLLLVAGGAFARLQAAEQIATTDEVKAAFLFNFAKFVEWPADAPGDASPFVIGVIDSNGIGDALRELVRTKSIGNRSISVKRLAADDDLISTQMLFVGQAGRAKVVEVLRRASKAAVLTVSDVDSFCEQGGIIALTLEGNHVRFEVNLDPAERVRLKISSKLLALARKVHPSSAIPPGSR